MAVCIKYVDPYGMPRVQIVFGAFEIDIEATNVHTNFRESICVTHAK